MLNSLPSTSGQALNATLRRAVLVLAVAFGLVSCATPTPDGSATDGGEAASAGNETPEAPAVPEGMATSATALAQLQQDAAEPSEPVLYRGTDRVVNLPKAAEPVRFIGDDVSLNFEQAPLTEVVHAVLGDILAQDYVVDHPISGEVTLRTRTPIPRDQLLGVLESLLKANGALLVQGADGRYIVTASQQASRISPRVTNAASLGPGYSTIIVPLRHISAGNMAQILKPVADESAFVRIDKTRNLLMLAGTREQLDGWLDIVNTFDVDMLKAMSVGIFPLENASVEEIDMALAELLGRPEGEGGAIDISGMVRIIPVARLNSLLVVTPRAHYLDKVKLWIERLDTTPNANFEKRLYVYPVQNTTAGRLADLLNGIYSGTAIGAAQQAGRAGAGARAAYATGGVAPGLTPETVSGSSSTRTGSSSSMSGSRTGSAGSPGIGSGSTMPAFAPAAGTEALSPSEFTLGDVRVVADDENNALMIYASGKDYKKIKEALDKLDVVATQVLIEASILEVTLTDELKYGLEWSFNASLDGSHEGAGLLQNTADPIGPNPPGFSYTITNSVGNIRAVLNTLSQDSLINVISTPSVLVLDNNTAYIHVGDQIPILTGTTTTDGGNTTQSIEYRDTGVKLSVKPSVNAGGLVTLDVQQSVTDVGTIQPNTQQYSFLERNIQSRVAVRSSEAVVLGGLIRERADSGSSGVPILHKLPLIGGLFGTVQESDRRTELLVIITPRVLSNEAELREVSKEMRERIREMELIEPTPGA